MGKAVATREFGLMAALAILVLLVASCDNPFRGAPAHLRIAIATVTCAEADVGAVVRNTISESLLNHRDFITLCDSVADKPDLIVLATVTFGSGSGSESGGFAYGNVGGSSSKSTAGQFVNDVSLVVKTPTNQTVMVSTHGQGIKGGGSLQPPSSVTWVAADDLVQKLKSYAISINQGQ